MNPDSPETSKDRDILGRWPLAVNVFELIRSAQANWSLRIGIYGRWGEGKTTALNFIEALAKKDGYRTAWFIPWAAQDRNQLWNGFADALREAFEQPLSLKTKRRLFDLLRSGEEWVGAVSNVHAVAKIIPGLIGKLSKQLAVKRSDIEPLLATLGDKKLIVFIDDLDRARHDLVPYLLLSLREVLDLPQCAFVLAFDPYVVAKVLPHVHPGWGATPEFLDKIVDYPFWLPLLDKQQVLALAKTQLAIGAHVIPEKVIADVADLLPANPRQLKLFFRKLWRLKAVLDRHEEEEIDWVAILLVDLIRNVSYRVAERLFDNDEFLKEMFTSLWAGKLLEGEKAEGVGHDEWVSIVKETVKELKDTEEIDEAEVLRLLNVLRVKSSILRTDNFKYWVQIGDKPPSLTWKEFKELMKGWERQPNKEFLRHFLEEHAAKLDHATPMVARELFRTLIDYRQSKLERAADSDLESELTTEMKSAGLALSCLETLIADFHGFSEEGLGLGLNEYDWLYSHCKRWAHFLNHDLYREARRRELRLLGQAARDGDRFASEILQKLNFWIEPHEMDAAMNELHRQVIEFFLPAIRKDLLGRFSRKDGISSLWGKDSHLIEKAVLFDKKYAFYSEETTGSLRDIAQRAAEDEGIQANFLEFLRLLAYGFEKILSPLTRADLVPLANDKEIIGMAWSAATTRRLQPRVLSSLDETRKVLEAVAGAQDHLPIPKWASDSIAINVIEEGTSKNKVMN